MEYKNYLQTVILVAANFIDSDKHKLPKVNILSLSHDELHSLMNDLLHKVPENCVHNVANTLFGFEFHTIDEVIYLVNHKLNTMKIFD